jgi:hypothetical protein
MDAPIVRKIARRQIDRTGSIYMINTCSLIVLKLKLTADYTDNADRKLTGSKTRVRFKGRKASPCPKHLTFVKVTAETLKTETLKAENGQRNLTADYTDETDPKRLSR